MVNKNFFDLKNFFIYEFFLLHLVWADNADVVSLQYAGTGALKTDYTRYEKSE
jgi:hypothetical protein